MKYWYQTPDSALTAYVRTVLVLEGFSNADPASLPIVTNGMPALLCKTDKEESQHETVQELMLYGKSTPPESWTLGTQTTIIAYFFRPFALPVIFNVAAKRVTDSPIDLRNWNPHKANALRIQLTYASTTPKKMQVLDQSVSTSIKGLRKASLANTSPTCIRKKRLRNPCLRWLRSCTTSLVGKPSMRTGDQRPSKVSKTI